MRKPLAVIVVVALLIGWFVSHVATVADRVRVNIESKIERLPYAH